MSASAAAIEFPSLEDKIESIVTNLQRLLSEGYSLATAFSGGKDSSVMQDLALKAIARQVASGQPCPPCIILHGNTRLENPVIEQHAFKELERAQTFIHRHNLPVQIHVVQPGLSQNWLVNMIGGRSIANLPDGGAKCSMQMKVTPMQRAKRNIFANLGQDRVITLVGKRLDESDTRRLGMLRRGESAVDPIQNEQGEWILSPIMDYTLDDVFEHIGMVRSGLWEAYSDWDDLMEIYRAGNGGECELVVHSAGKPSSAGCGSRFGCHQCLRTQEDASMVNMLKDPDLQFMSGLHRLREYTRATHYDPTKRCWLSRSVNADGSISLSPNAYSPDHCADLLKFALTLDAQEEEAAERLGIAPRFQLLSGMDVLGIAFLQSRYGYSQGLDALYWYREVHYRGRRFPIPDVPVYPRERYGKGESVPFMDAEYGAMFAGLRDLDAACADAEHLTAKGADGKYYSGGAGADEFTVNAEAAEYFFAYELDYALEKYHGPDVNPTAALHYLLRQGLVSIYKGSHSQLDATLQMANQIHRLGLQPILHDREALKQTLLEAAA